MAFRIETMTVDAVVNGAHVLEPKPPGDCEPAGQQHDVERGGPANPDVQAGQAGEPARREPEEHAAGRIAGAVEHDIDGVLDAGPRGGGDRQIQQLVRRLVDGKAQPLVECIRHDDRPERRQQQNGGGSRSERGRQQQNRHRNPIAPQDRRRERQLHEQAHNSENEVERPEKPGQCFGVSAEPAVGDDAELKTRPLRRDRDEKHHGCNQAQVWGPADFGERLTERVAMRLAAARKAATPDFCVRDRHND